jgi:hypothetical protein
VGSSRVKLPSISPLVRCDISKTEALPCDFFNAPLPTVWSVQVQQEPLRDLLACTCARLLDERLAATRGPYAVHAAQVLH